MKIVLRWLALVPAAYLLATTHEWFYFPDWALDEALARGPLETMYRTPILRGTVGYAIELALIAGVIAWLRRLCGVSWSRALLDGPMHLLPLGLAPLVLFADHGQVRMMLFALLVGGVAAAVVFRCASAGDSADRRRSRRPRAIAAALCVLFGAYWTSFLWLQHGTYWSSVYDLGLFAGSLRSTVHGDGFLYSPQFACTFMAEHFAPVLALLAPLYAIHQDPMTLQVVMTAAMAGSAYLLFCLAEATLDDGWIALAFCTSYLLLPDTFHAQWHGFKMDLLEPAMILGAFLALRRGRSSWFLLCIGLLWATKEDAFVATTVLGLWAWVAHGRRRLGLGVVLVSLVVGVVLLGWVMPAYAEFQDPGVYFRRFSGEGYKFSRHFSHLGGDLPSAVAGAVGNPVYVVGYLASGDRFPAVLSLLVPLGFLIAGGGWRTLLLLVPSLEMLLSSFGYMYSLDYYYSARPLAFAYAGAVAGFAALLGRLPSSERAPESGWAAWWHSTVRIAPGALRRAVAAYLVCAALVLAYIDVDSPLSPVYRRPAYLRTQHTMVLDEVVARIPADAAVTATGYAGIHLMDRLGPDHLPFGLDRAEYVVMDLYRPTFPMDHATAVQFARALVRKPEWRVLRAERGVLFLRRGESSPEGVEAALRMLDRPTFEPEEWEMTQYPNLGFRDERASNGAALRIGPSDRRGAGLVFYGPGWPLGPGEYEAVFRLAASPDSWDDPLRTVATVGVYDEDNELVAGETLRFADFDRPGEWQEYRVAFHAGAEAPWDFRIYYHDFGTLAADVIRIERMGD